MRFGTNRIVAFLSSMFSSIVPERKKYTISHKDLMPEEPKKTHNKTGEPNWLKIAINSQKHR